MFPLISKKYNKCPPASIQPSYHYGSSLQKNTEHKLECGTVCQASCSKIKKRLQKNKQNGFISRTVCLKQQKLNSINYSINKNQLKNQSLQKSNHWKKAQKQNHQKLYEIEKQCRKVSKQKATFSCQNLCDIIETQNTDQNMMLETNQIDENNSTLLSYNSQFTSNFPTLNMNFQGRKSYIQNLVIKKIVTTMKPPHRYKSCLICTNNALILYGGLGCQRDLSWAKLHFQDMKWEVPDQNIQKKFLYKPQTPIFAHTLVSYKNKVIVFGGTNTAEINETSIINTDTMKIEQGEMAPVRRRNHAAVVYGDNMIIHGGIQNRQAKSQFFAYNIPQNKWTLLSCSNILFLSCHKIAKTHKNKKAKLYYIFGGITEKGQCSNKLYSLKMVSSKEIKFEKIECVNAPRARHSFCFEGISQTQLLLFGGKQKEQYTDVSLNIDQGVFNDIYLYHIETRQWTQIQTKFRMEHCFGMASSSISGKIFIFGGSTPEQYCDASIYMIRLNSPNNITDSFYDRSLEVDNETKQFSNYTSTKKIGLW